MTAKPLRPFFSYFGAKWRAAKLYDAPRFPRVVEPFAGSACYSLHYHDQDVVLCEAYEPVAAIWEWLIDCARRGAEREVLALPDLGERAVSDLGLAPGPAALIGFWCNGAVARPRQRMSAWAVSAHVKESAGERARLFWGPRVRERIAAQLPAIKHWTIVRGRFENAPVYGPPSTYFFDPPYQKAGHAYGVSDVDYRALATYARIASDDGNQVIVCEAEGAAWLPFRPLGTVRAMTKRGGRVSREVVWP